MPLTRVYAEGFGPFEKLDLDFSDGKGNPHPGPHILCGVNGCGKSTALRVIAWLLAEQHSGFPTGWLAARRHQNREQSRALLEFQDSDQRLSVVAGSTRSDDESMRSWLIEAKTSSIGAPTVSSYEQMAIATLGMRLREPGISLGSWGCKAAYSPSVVRSLASPSIIGSSSGPLSFESTILSDSILPWWKTVYLSRAVAKEKGLEGHISQRLTTLLDSAIETISGGTVELGLDIESLDPIPAIRYRGKKYTFDQLPSGMLAVLGVLTDFFRRMNEYRLEMNSSTLPAGLLLFDEIDASLHPLWQRRILPALRKALPHVQIICTTHSPFVINSCRESRVHVLNVLDDGSAVASEPMNAPFGHSFAATIKEIFAIPTEYDWETERELKEWQELKRKRAEGSISQHDETRLTMLTTTLSARGEELRSLVQPVGNLEVDEIIAMLAKAKAS